MEDCPSTTLDIITHSDTVEGAFQRICSILSHCNKKRLVFTEDGIKPAAKYTDSIRDFPTPRNILEVRVWYG
jgi:hypothetical protein